MEPSCNHPATQLHTTPRPDQTTPIAVRARSAYLCAIASAFWDPALSARRISSASRCCIRSSVMLHSIFCVSSCSRSTLTCGRAGTIGPRNRSRQLPPARAAYARAVIAAHLVLQAALALPRLVALAPQHQRGVLCLLQPATQQARDSRGREGRRRAPPAQRQNWLFAPAAAAPVCCIVRLLLERAGALLQRLAPQDYRVVKLRQQLQRLRDHALLGHRGRPRLLLALVNGGVHHASGCEARSPVGGAGGAAAGLGR